MQLVYLPSSVKIRDCANVATPRAGEGGPKGCTGVVDVVVHVVVAVVASPRFATPEEWKNYSLSDSAITRRRLLLGEKRAK